MKENNVGVGADDAMENIQIGFATCLGVIGTFNDERCAPI
jgi:hypothetical protein